MVNTQQSSDNPETGRHPRGKNWTEEYDNAIVYLLQTRWKELAFGDAQYRNREDRFQLNIVDFAGEWL